MFLLGVLIVIAGIFIFARVFSRLSRIQSELDELNRWREAVHRKQRGLEPEPPSVPAPPPRPVAIPTVIETPAPEPVVLSAARRALLEEAALRRQAPAPAPAAETVPAAEEMPA